MHRSGTSLTAQWLNKCGLNIGDNLLPENFSNKDGHFEDIDFHDIHEEIFKSHDIPYGGFINIDNFELTFEDKTKLEKLIKQKHQKNKQWGWKEPRTCLFIKEYLEILPNAKFLLILRDYKSIINSLTNRAIKPIDLKVKSNGRLWRIRWLKFRLTKRRQIIKNFVTIYSKATDIYYLRLINTLPDILSKNLIVVQFEEIREKSPTILNKLITWGFCLNYTPIDSIFKKNYITSRKNNRKLPKYLDIKLQKLYNKLLEFKNE